MSDLLARLRDALADRYAIEKELGRGGMATVFLARDVRHDRPVAIKVMGHELSAQLGTDRFLREIRTAATLNHPNVLPLYDSGEAAGVLYYVMPFVDGGSLRERLDREGQLSVDEAVAIAREVADALSHAHSLGVVHRDIKPENILFLSGRPVVADFGIARALDASGGEQITQTGMAIGTPAYMSPEQAAGDTQVDGRSDLYALGCVLYEMLAGRPPFTGASSREIMARHAMDPVPPLRSARPTVGGGIEDVVLRSLAKVPADRFATASAMSEALALGGSRQITPSSGPIRAFGGAPTIWQRLRSPRALAAAALLVIAVGVGVVVRNGPLGAATVAVTVTDEEGNTIERVIPTAEARKRVGVFYLDHDPADSAAAWLAYGLPSALGMDLLQNIFIDLRDPGQSRDRVREAGFPRLVGMPNGLLREIAQEQFREQYVRGRVRTEGEEFVVEYTIHATASGEVLQRGEVRSGNPLDLVDPITQAISGTVDVPEGYRGEVRDLPARELMTSSAAAFADYSRAIQALSVRDDYVAASALLQRATAADPTFTAAQYQLYVTLLLQGRPQDGAPALQAAVDHLYRMPERVQNQVRSNWYEVRQQQDRAYAVIEMNAELYPHDILALTALAQVQVLRDQRPEAIGTYERILELDPGGHDFLLAIGGLHRSLGNYDEALAALRRYTRANPDDARGFVEVGNLHRERGEHDDARSAYERAVLLDENDVATLLRIAGIDMSLGNFAAARAGYERVLREARNSTDSASALGALEAYHRVRGQMDEALRVGQRALALAARTTAPMQAQFRLLLSLGDHIAAGDTTEAFRLLAEYSGRLQAPLDALVPLAHLAIAVELEDPARLDSAAAGIERTIAQLGLETFQPNVAFARGLAHFLRGEYREAVARWEEEQGLNPGDYTVNRQLGQAWRELGDHARAEEYLEAALRIRPADPLTRYQLGLLYRDMNRRDDAVRELRAALDVWQDADADFKWARRAREALAGLGG